MGGFHGFGSTIIDSYLKGLHYRQQHEEQIAQRQLEQKRIDQSQQQFLDTLELHKKTADLQAKSNQVQEDLAREHVKQVVLESIAKGQTKVPEPVEQTPDQQQAFGFANLNSQPTQIQNPSTGQLTSVPAPQFDTSPTIRPPMQIGTGVTAQTLTGDQYRTPSEQGRANAELAGPVLEQQHAAKLEDLMNQFKLQTLGREQQAAAALKLEGVKQKGKAADTAVRMATSERNAQLQAQAKILAKANPTAKFDPGEVADVVAENEVGNAKLPSPSSAAGIHARSLLHKNGSVEIDPKRFDKIDALGSLPLVFSQLEDFANRNLSDSKGIGPFATSLKAKVPQTDIANELAQLKINSGPIARIYEGQTGRLTMMQMQLAMDAMTSGKITKGQALDRINTLKKEAASKVANETLSGVPDSQKLKIIEARPAIKALFPHIVLKDGSPAISLDGGVTFIREK